ncbi:MAG TPA: putative toxin-antitoxin system toxin component, PIN family [Gammaproteobacteria bacterium]|nr:putative toxin-antitoxin system toxin component, PIN family [Gammaproteobacteria bacterium]
MIGGLWIIDTNVVVSGIITSNADSPAAFILNRMVSADIRFALCEDLIAEYRNVLLRRSIRRIHRLDEGEVDRILASLIENGVIVDISARRETASDPGDHHLWRLLAACSNAGLVTGDSLLVRNPPPHALVLAPRDYLNQSMLK